MKKLLSIAMLLMLMVSVGEIYAQDKKKPSPAASASGEVDGVKINVNYHQPSAKGREIMGGLVPYNEVWRTGANDATTFEISENLMIEGEELPKGKYSLFTIPGEEEWTIIFNNVAKQWGAYDYNADQDALRVTVPAGETDEFVETFNIAVEGDHVVLSWENTEVKFEVSK